MATTPEGDRERDDAVAHAADPAVDPAVDSAVDHVVRNLFDGELEQLAFGRPHTAEEQRKADAAARELARRAEQHASRMGEDVAVAQEAGLSPAPGRVDGPAAERPVSMRDSSGRDRDQRPWWTRTAVVVGAGILVVIGATSIGPLLPTNPGSLSSLDVFLRDATVQERDLQTQYWLGERKTAGQLQNLGANTIADEREKANSRPA